ncbi:MAG: hypothetical protein RBR02_08055 [Desulfuromonadaceae bacterium]|nr:hypothetical protein [Desulfuromonadaceae bacterium]
MPAGEHGGVVGVVGVGFVLNGGMVNTMNAGGNKYRIQSLFDPQRQFYIAVMKQRTR